jgi:hypothetical protein
MHRRLIAAATFALIAANLAACSTAMPTAQHYAVVPLKSNGQVLQGMDSRVTLESRQPGGIVSIRGDDQFADFGAGFIVAVQNKTGAPLEFGPKNIEASLNGKPLPVLGAEELDTKVKASIRSYVRATSRTDTVDISNASDTVNREYQYNNVGGNAAGQGGGAGCALTVDHCATYRQDRINRELQADTVAQAATRLQASEQLIAKKALHTSQIKPDAMGGGILVIEPPKGGGVVDITITVNGQKHRFSFTATPTT